MLSAVVDGRPVRLRSTRRMGGSSAARSTRASCAGSSGSGAGSTRRDRLTSRSSSRGDYNVTPADEDVWDPVKAHGGTHVSEPERDALARLREWGLTDAYRSQEQRGGRFSWWDYRAGMFHRNEGMRIDLLYVTEPIAKRVVWAEIDREARKGPPVPSDHAPGGRRPRRAGHAVRCRLGRGTRPDPGANTPGWPEEPGPGPLREGAPARLTAREDVATGSAERGRCAAPRPLRAALPSLRMPRRRAPGPDGANVGSPPDDGPRATARLRSA